jgi:hypothetical protein
MPCIPSVQVLDALKIGFLIFLGVHTFRCYFKPHFSKRMMF